MAAPTVQPRDRVNLGPGWLIAMAAMTALSVGSAGVLVSSHSDASAAIGFATGTLVAVLVVFALPSVSVRLAGLVPVLVGAALAVRFGELPFGASGGLSLPVIGWIVGTVGALVVANAIGSQASPALRGCDVSRGWTSAARATTACILVVLMLVIVIAPLVTQRLASATQAGAAPSVDASGGGDTTLQSANSLDLGSRPQLSDSVVMTVDSDRPAFWRGETYDVWTGRSWFRTDQSIVAVPGDGTVVPDPFDDGARGSDELVQRFRIQARYADVIYAASSATRVLAATPVAQRTDGTLFTPFRPMGRGATYTVVSRRAPVTADVLRTAGRRVVPLVISRRFAQPTVATGRVRRLATELAVNESGSFDKVMAIERWLSRHVTYSIDAPLAGNGRDVVDDFLFRSHQGWCEQVATSLVVLLRAQGVPARLVTGFVPNDIDPISGIFTVREKDAHAWAEVYFPGVGWQAFDPTAAVPLAGNAPRHSAASIWLRSTALLLALLGAGALLLGGPLLLRLVRGAPERRRRRRAVLADEHAWATSAAHALDRIGRRARRPRYRSETSTSYASALSEALDEPRLVGAGRAVDVAAYAAQGPPDLERGAVDSLLGSVNTRLRKESRWWRGRLRR
ncbi:MAG: DUF3488 and transglutaminase-like domain-containing protein [Actinomycetota bacterium]|nr:DUF3488 and transglutaminase-like domain-containing protein [Actinomycetota bacterium]